MRIALLGCGTVGSGVVEIIEQMNAKGNKTLTIAKILVKEKKDIVNPAMTCDFNDILKDDSIDTVIEVMGGYHPAYEYILASLKAHKHVVTANKAVVAHYFEEFMKAAKENQVNLMIEATTGGGIPWIKGILRAKRFNEISEVKGIFNGTTNFILDNMHRNNVEFDEILTKAQNLGYAEADPSADIDGFDIQRKCQISANLAFNTLIHEEAIDRFGIRSITKEDVEVFKKRHLVCKLMAVAKRFGDEIVAYVEPTLYHETNLMANVESNFNIACLIGDYIGELKFYGQGAGKLPTADAIIQDCFDLESGEANLYKVIFDQHLAVNNELELHHYYLRIKEDIAEESYLKDISISNETMNENNVYYTKRISVKEMHELAKRLVASDDKLFFAALQDNER